VIAKLTLLIALVAGLMLCSCGPPLGTRTGACDAHRPGAALVTPYVVVYASRTGPGGTTTYYACLRPGGHREELGIDEPAGVYGSDATTGGFSAAGTYVVAQSASGEASLAVCARYSNTRRCTPAQHWLSVVDTKTRRHAHVPIYTGFLVPVLVPFPVTVALSSKAAVAWLENSTVGSNVSSELRLWATVLNPRGRSSLAALPAMIDAGSIDPSSVRFDRRTLYWIRDREQHHQELR
jgi:hypothetical protein